MGKSYPRDRSLKTTVAYTYLAILLAWGVIQIILSFEYNFDCALGCSNNNSTVIISGSGNGSNTTTNADALDICDADTLLYNSSSISIHVSAAGFVEGAAVNHMLLALLLACVVYWKDGNVFSFLRMLGWLSTAFSVAWNVVGTIILFTTTISNVDSTDIVNCLSEHVIASYLLLAIWVLSILLMLPHIYILLRFSKKACCCCFKVCCCGCSFSDDDSV